MKIHKLIVLLLLVFAAACKMLKVGTGIEEEYPTAELTDPTIRNVDSAEGVTMGEKERAATANESKGGAVEEVFSREEYVTITEGESKSFGNKRYYAILGSFSVYENAQSFKEQLVAEGMAAAILVNKKGLFRVCAGSYEKENNARSRVSHIRRSTHYDDAWLLINKGDF